MINISLYKNYLTFISKKNKYSRINGIKEKTDTVKKEKKY